MTVNAEITFMVYAQNGIGRLEKRTVELSYQDYSALSGSNRNDNVQLKNWARNMFPSAKDVKIQGITKK